MADIDVANLDLSQMSRDEMLEILDSLAEPGIRITFSGKTSTRSMMRKVRPRLTKPVPKHTIGTHDEQARNCLIEGDNLQAMATLYKDRGQVDLILTDPPYNTGNDFRYNDKWEDDPNDPGMGEFVSKDDGSRHTKWMRFMWPRLQMMHAMLKPEGVLAICIDHRELFRLGQMLDELFREESRIAIINWQKSYSPRSDSVHVSTATEYVLVYAKDLDRTKTGLLDRTAEMDARYTNSDDDPRGLWKPGGDASGPDGEGHPTMVYGIQNPFTGEIKYPADGGCWRAGRTKMKKWLQEWGSKYEDRDIGDGRPSKALVLKGAAIEFEDGEDPRYFTPASDPVLKKSSKAATRIRDRDVWPELYFTKKGEGGPARKRYLKEVKQGYVPITYWARDTYDLPEVLGATSWDHEQSGHSQTGVNELTAIVGKGHGFKTVKPLRLMQKVIQLWCPPDGIVLDPFAGSGTTGHAVLASNAVSGAERTFKLVEQGRPEKGDSYAQSLTADRLRRAVTGDWANGKGKPLGGGFKFMKLDKKVDAEALLQMEREEMADTVIASHFDTSKRRQTGLISVDRDEYTYLVGRNSEGEGFYLVWSGSGGEVDFTEDVYEACASEAARAGLKAHYHVYARFDLYQTANVTFYQIPDRILSDFGLDLRSDAFTEEPSRA